jgi:hypothetical protein
VVPSGIVKVPKFPDFLNMAGKATLRPLAVIQVHGLNSATLALEHAKRTAFFVFMAKA